MGDHQYFPLSVLLQTKDMRQSMAFLRDVLGFTFDMAWPDGPEPVWANFHLDNQSVMLGAVTSKEAANSMCAGDAEAMVEANRIREAMAKHPAGIGVVIYMKVADVDAYHATLRDRGVKTLSTPKTQFYGQRDFSVRDPNGYQFTFYSPVSLSSCQSCGMPLADKKGAMYCQHCTDAKGHLKPFERVLEGTTVGYFMGMKKLPRAEAEKAARAHLASMPAWQGRK